MLNKPRGYTTVTDDRGRMTVTSLVDAKGTGFSR